MKRAIFPTTDEEREIEIEHDKALVIRVLAEIAPRGDMAQMEEPQPEPRRIPWGVLAYAGALCVVVAWLAFGGVL